MIQDLVNDLIGRNFYIVMDHQHDPATVTYRKLEAKARRANAMNNDDTLPYNDPTNAHAQSNIEAAMIRMDADDEHPFQSSLTAVLYARTATELDSATEDAVNAISRITGTAPIIGGTQNPHVFLKDALPFNGTQRLDLTVVAPPGQWGLAAGQYQLPFAVLAVNLDSGDLP